MRRCNLAMADTHIISPGNLAWNIHVGRKTSTIMAPDENSISISFPEAAFLLVSNKEAIPLTLNVHGLKGRDCS